MAIHHQDSANCNGGKWIIRFKKAVSGRFWEDLVSGAILKLLIFSNDLNYVLVELFEKSDDELHAYSADIA